MRNKKVLFGKVDLSNGPVVVLVRPQLGQNIGGVARAMGNFSSKLLRVVEPRDGWPNQQAVAVASRSGNILDSARVYDSTAAACADLNFIFATTVRQRNLTKTVFEPKLAMVKALKLMSSGNKVGILFGSERAGLENLDIALSNAIITLPVDADYSSVNLSQSAGIILYEWFKLKKRNLSVKNMKNKSKIASKDEIEKLWENLHKQLSNVNYFWPDGKKRSMEENLYNLLNNGALTDADVKTIHGVIKALVKKIG